jgi:peroxiredoxin
MAKTKTLTALFLALAVNVSFGAAIPNSPKDVQPLEIGSAVPAVAVQTTTGAAVQLNALTQGKPSVIIFYRGGWCPYCTRHLAALGEVEPELRARGYQILAISTDNAEHAAATEADTELGYQLFADSKMDAAKAFGLAYKVDPPTLEKLASYKIDIEAASGETHHLLPVPAIFLTDAQEKITFRHFDADYTARLDAEELLKAAK